VKIRDDDFRTRTASRTIPGTLEADATLWRIARELLRELRRRRRRGVRLLGVGVSSLVEGAGPRQLELFRGDVSAESERQRTLSRIVDDLKERFGEDAVLPGGLLEEGED
jgi:hypothetical protein